MPRKTKLPIRSKTAFRLTQDQRSELLRIAGVKELQASQIMFRCIEQIIATYRFDAFLKDSFKPSHARACLRPLIAIIRKAESDPAQIPDVKRTTWELDWNVAADLLMELKPPDVSADLPNLPYRGTDIPRSIDFGRDLPTLIAQDLPRSRRACEELLDSYRGDISPRRPTVKARGKSIRDLVRCFEVHSPLDPSHDGQDLVEEEYADRICQFVDFALRSAGIAPPALGDVTEGAQHQGRLRREIKEIRRPS